MYDQMTDEMRQTCKLEHQMGTLTFPLNHFDPQMVFCALNPLYEYQHSPGPGLQRWIVALRVVGSRTHGAEDEPQATHTHSTHLLSLTLLIKFLFRLL